MLPILSRCQNIGHVSLSLPRPSKLKTVKSFRLENFVLLLLLCTARQVAGWGLLRLGEKWWFKTTCQAYYCPSLASNKANFYHTTFQSQQKQKPSLYIPIHLCTLNSLSIVFQYSLNSLSIVSQ